MSYVSAKKPVTQRILGPLHEDKLTKLMNTVIRKKLQIIPDKVIWGGKKPTVRLSKLTNIFFKKG